MVPHYSPPYLIRSFSALIYCDPWRTSASHTSSHCIPLSSFLPSSLPLSLSLPPTSSLFSSLLSSSIPHLYLTRHSCRARAGPGTLKVPLQQLYAERLCTALRDRPRPLLQKAEQNTERMLKMRREREEGEEEKGKKGTKVK